MDARTLGLTEDMRIWHNEGLQFVFCDQDVATLRPAAQADARPPAARMAEPARVGGASSGPPSAAGRAWARPERGAPVAPTAKAAASTPAATATAPRARPAAQPAPTPASAAPMQPAASQGGELAVFPWDDFRKKLVVPARMVWTYWELGQDFGGNPLVERRELFGNIMHHLKWPRRIIAFWPLSFVNQGDLIANKGSFLRGVRETQATSIVCFGKKAFTVLFPRERFSFGRHSMGNLTVTVLPGPGAMLAGDVAAKRMVWDTLRKMKP